jgi:hypothetical protein
VTICLTLAVKLTGIEVDSPLAHGPRRGLGWIMSLNNIDLSRILSLIITVLTDPYDKFIDKLHADGRITDGEVTQLRQALKDQIPRLSELVRPTASKDDP